MYFRYLFYFFRRTFFIFLLGIPLQQNGHNYINTCPFDPGGGSKFQPRHTARDSNASITTIREKMGSKWSTYSKNRILRILRIFWISVFWQKWRTKTAKMVGGTYFFSCFGWSNLLPRRKIDFLHSPVHISFFNQISLVGAQVTRPPIFEHFIVYAYVGHPNVFMLRS